MQPSSKNLLYTVYLLYFLCGLAQCFDSIFLPEFKEYFGLSYTEQMLTQFARNIPFLFFSLAVGYGISRIGYLNSMVISVFLFSLGTWLLVPAIDTHQYALVLAAFFVIGIAFNFEIVAGNPLLSMLGDAAGSAARLNTGNALGAIAQICGPLIITFLIPAAAATAADKIPYLKNIFLVTSLTLLFVGILLALTRSRIPLPRVAGAAVKEHAGSIWQESRVVLGFVAIFLVLGTEAGLFGLFRNYLEAPTVGGMSSQQSQQMFTVYFALFALGRITGSWVQKRVPARTVISASLVACVLLVSSMIFATGAAAVVCILMLGFFASILFPTLYAIAISGLGERTGQASGLLTMGFLGSACLPVLQGMMADAWSVNVSFAIGVVPYLFALYYVLRGDSWQRFLMRNNLTR